MSDDIAIKVENLTKIYKLYNSPVDRLKESLLPFGRKYHHDFHALDDVSFEIRKGETVGIIGKNGSGKSTLLKILVGVLTPSSGCVTVNGKINALLELGSGFNPELTGVENVYFNGILMGYSRAEMDSKLDDILSFADIGEFVRQPVKTYSSGMFVRLAFAVAVSVDPEILIIDEALAVGDAAFQQKCVKKMEGFRSNGGNIIFVSHDMNSLKVLCESAILLDRGALVDRADSESVVNMYNSLLVSGGSPLLKRQEKMLEHGNLKVRIFSVEMFNEREESTEIFLSGERATVQVSVKTEYAVSDLCLGLLIRNKFGQDIFGVNSKRYINVSLAAGEQVRYTYSIQLSLAGGGYTLSLAAHSGNTHLEDTYHWCDVAKTFEIVANEAGLAGMVHLDTSLQITRKSQNVWEPYR